MKRCIVIIDLHCDPTIPSGAGDIGGGNTYSRSLLKELQNANIYHIYITRKKYPTLDEYVQMTPFSEFYRINLGDWGPMDKDVLQNYHELSKKKIIDILSLYTDYYFVFHSSYWQSGMLAYDIAPLYNTFYVHTILSNAKKKKVAGVIDNIVEQRILVEEKIFANAKYLICSSISEMKEMQELYNIPKERLLLAGLKVDNHYLSPAYNSRGEIRINTLKSIEENENYLSYYSHEFDNDNGLWWNQKNYIYFGRIHKNKGIKEIIIAWKRAFDIIGKFMPNLWIVGGAPSQIEIFRNGILKETPWLEECEKQHRIIWWGTLPPDGISTLLLKSAVLITHSKYEAGGLVLLEALSQGVPVIATPNGYGNDYLVDWYNGFKVNYKDIDSLTQKILYFCGQPFLHDYMGTNAKQSSVLISQSFDFLHTHKLSYGIVSEETSTNYIPPNRDWYQVIKQHSMDTYPYLTELPTTQEIIHILQNNIDCVIREIKEKNDPMLDFKLWEISTDKGAYLFIYYYDIINTTNIWNPYSNEDYVLTKSQRVNIIVDTFEKIDDSPIIYKNSACGYILYRGNILDVFCKKRCFIEPISSDEEQRILYSKFLELLKLLNSDIMKRHNIQPLIKYLQCLMESYFSDVLYTECNIPYISIYRLFIQTLDNLTIILYDKIGLKFSSLRESLNSIIDISEIVKRHNLSIKILWYVYFEFYNYIEHILVYPYINKSKLIKAIFELY